MSRKLTVLDRVEVSSPCSADWDEMKGNDVVRFCEHCNLNVTDLSSMTRTRATKLILKSKGRLCVRYTRKPDGAIQTATQKVYQISRRASRITAGVFSAVLSLSATAFAQSQQTTTLTKEETIVLNEVLKQKDETKPPSLKGTVTDPNGALIPGATVRVVNQETGKEEVINANQEGSFEFSSLDAGLYRVIVKAQGFADKESMAQITADNTAEINAQLYIAFNAEVNVNADSTEIQLVISGGAMMIVYETPLLAAVADEDIDAVREALAKKVNVNAKEEGTSALHLAVSHGNTDIVRLLLERHADPNIRDADKQTPLMMIYDDTPAEIVELLLNAGAKVNLKDSEGQTPLMIAAESGNVEIVQLLLSAGAKVDRRDNEGRTALMYAVEEEDFESVKAILAAVADINIRDNEGKSALRLALETGNEEIIKWLKGYGAYEEEEPSKP